MVQSGETAGKTDEGKSLPRREEGGRGSVSEDQAGDGDNDCDKAHEHERINDTKAGLTFVIDRGEGSTDPPAPRRM
jgi:hypothetical protein